MTVAASISLPPRAATPQGEPWVAFRPSQPQDPLVLVGRPGTPTRPTGTATPASAPDWTAWEEACTNRIRVFWLGTLYNREALARELQLEGASRADAASIVLEGYRRWGEDCFARLRGAFAVLVHDARENRLLATRDPLGSTPLFHARVGDEVRFACAIEALTQSPGASQRINRAAIADHLRHRWPKVDETFYESVRRVPPGHVMAIQGRTETYRRYWDPAPLGTRVNWVREGALEQFDALLDQVVERSISFGPTGIYLSGGLDSVSVAAVASAACRRRGLPVPHAFSLVFPHEDCNEEQIQRGVASDLNLPQVILPIQEAAGHRNLMEAALELTGHMPSPLLSFWLPAYLRLGDQAVENGCRTILTGAGGDEWLGVTPVLAADLVREFNFLGLYRLWRSNHRSYEVARLDMLRAVLWTFGLRPVLREYWKRSRARAALAQGVQTYLPAVSERRAKQRAARALPGWLAPDLDLRRDLDERLQLIAAAAAAEPESESFYLRELRVTLDHPLIALEMEETFTASRRIGARYAQPYWDPDLVDLLCRIPPDVLNRGNRSKGLVRESLERRFPGQGFRRQKKALATSFFTTRILHDAGQQWKRMGGIQALADHGVVEPAALEEILSQQISGAPVRYAQLAWNVLNLEAWVRSRS